MRGNKSTAIDVIKGASQNKRLWLAQLAIHAYQDSIGNNPAVLLELNIRQAKKYQRYQFCFDPTKGYQFYQTHFEKVFEKKNAEEIFKILQAEHPFGVELWVNPFNAKKYPLYENITQLSVDSIFTASCALLEDLKNERLATIEAYYQEEDKESVKNRITSRYNFILNSFQIKHERISKKIKTIYKNKNFDYDYPNKSLFRRAWIKIRYKLGNKSAEQEYLSPETKQFIDLENELQKFHHLVCAKLALFDCSPEGIPSKKDYKYIYEKLATYEQKQKLAQDQTLQSPEIEKEIKESDTDPQGNNDSLDKPHDDADDDQKKKGTKGKEKEESESESEPEQQESEAASESESVSDDKNTQLADKTVNKPNLDKSKSTLKKILQGPLTQQFNRDIFCINLENNDKTLTGRYYYHSRKYTLTTHQAKTQATSVVPTATAHNPEYLLPNFALLEEGQYNLNSEQQLTPDFFVGRHGSPSPVELYARAYNKHQTAYYTLLNMEQQQQQLRARLIEGLLLNDKSIEVSRSAEITKIKAFSEQLAAQITKKLHERRTHENKFTREHQIPAYSLLTEAIRDTTNLGAEERLPENIQYLNLHARTAAMTIVYCPNFFTHLITAKSIGGLSEHQNRQYKDCRAAQYATWDQRPGFIYECTGVNKFRKYRGISNSQQGNNAVALIELYKAMTSQNDETESAIDLKTYNYQLKTVCNSAKAYFSQLEKNYINSLNLLNFKKSELEKINRQLKLLPESEQNELANKKNKLVSSINHLKKILENKRKELNELRTTFRTQERALHKQAIQLVKLIHRQLAQKDEQTLDIKNRTLKVILYLHVSGQWKLEHYNGVMQALIHFLTNQIGMFSSFGCKSANDRALFIALLISQIAKNKDPFKGNSSRLQTNILEEAQKAYAWHISHRQTVLDHSAIPKTEKSMLVYVDQFLKEPSLSSESASSSTPSSNTSSLKAHLQFKFFAAHKRKNLYQKMHHTDWLKSMDNLYRTWRDQSPSNSLAAIEQRLLIYCIERQSDNNYQKQLIQLKALKANLITWQNSWWRLFSSYEDLDAAKWLKKEIISLQYLTTQFKQKTTQTAVDQLKTFFMTVSNEINLLQRDSLSKPEKTLLSTLAKLLQTFNIQENNYSLYKLIIIFNRLQEYAVTAVNTLTFYDASFFVTRSSPAVRDFFMKLACYNLLTNPLFNTRDNKESTSTSAAFRESRRSKNVSSPL